MLDRVRPFGVTPLAVAARVLPGWCWLGVVFGVDEVGVGGDGVEAFVGCLPQVHAGADLVDDEATFVAQAMMMPAQICEVRSVWGSAVGVLDPVVVIALGGWSSASFGLAGPVACVHKRPFGGGGSTSGVSDRKSVV